MKIGQLDNSPKLAPAAADARRAAPADARSAPAEASAQVQLSAAATLLAAQGNTADFDAEKVARIAQAVRKGQFEINAEAVADRLIAHTRDLIGPKAP
jgi:negative regulator of flagellin synthesis FlgM